MTSLLVLNVALFVPAVVGGVATSVFGWWLAGRDGHEDGGGGGRRRGPSPVHPLRPSPVEPRERALPGELARSA